jgi:hypothetical protein
LGIARAALGSPQILERLPAVAELVIAQREIIGQNRLESLQLHGLFQDCGGVLEVAPFIKLAGFAQGVLDRF